MPTHQNSTKSYEERKEEGKIESWRRRVFDVFAVFPLVQLTDREIMNRLGATDASLVRPEITRLTEDGILKEAGKTKCHWTGKTVRLSEWSGRSYFARGNRK